MGTSFRMGPGYFPMLLSVLMIGLGLAMAAMAWRGPAAGCGERALALAGLVLVVVPVACSASPCAGWASRRSWSWWCWFGLGESLRQPARLGAAGLGHRRLLLVPIHQRPGPAFAAVRTLGQPGLLDCGSAAPAARHRAGAVGAGRHGTARQSGPGLRDRAQSLEPALRLRRLPARHRGGRTAGAGAGRHHRHAAAIDLLAAAGLGPDHAGRDLLRRPVRRLDHRDPDQPARANPPRW